MGEVLFLAHRVPWPPNRGDKIRSHHILHRLAELAPVHCACFADDAREAAQEDPLRHKLASFHAEIRRKPKWQAGVEALVSARPVSLTSFASAALHDHVDRLLRERPIGLIFVFSGQMAQYIPQDFDGRVVMDFADVDSAKFESYAGTATGFMGWIHGREGRLLSEFEREIGERADLSLFVSEAEATLFRKRSGLPAEKVLALGNGIDLEQYNPAVGEAVDREAGPLLVFTGQMDYPPNVEAVMSFAQQVMRLILAEHRDARFAIVGRAPTAEVLALDGKNGAFVAGEVDDVRGWLLAADIVVAPLRTARGIQNKVLEAMAMGKAVVVSLAAAEGIEAVAGEQLLVAANEAEEAEQVCQWLADAERREKLGREARRLIEARYSWAAQLAELPEICALSDNHFAEAAE